MENTQKIVRWSGLATLVLGLAAGGYEVLRWHNSPTAGRALTYEQAQIENGHTVLGFAGVFIAVVGALVVYAASSDISARQTPYRKEAETG